MKNTTRQKALTTASDPSEVAPVACGTEPDAPVHGTWGDPCYAAGRGHDGEVRGQNAASSTSDVAGPHGFARSDVR